MARIVFLRAFLLITVCTALIACAYPRRATPLTPVDETDRFAPSETYTLKLISAELPPKRKGDLSWDDDGPPDAYLKIFRDGELIFESTTTYNTNSPQWNYAAQENLYLPSSATFRFELWDRDDVDSDPAGVWSGSGLPASALPGATAHLDLEGGATVAFEISAPTAYRGTGVPSYEIRSDEVLALEVLPNSPAGRAGLKAGDKIIQIGARTVNEMTDAQVTSALSLAGQEKATMIVITKTKERKELQLDNGKSYPVK